MKRMILLILPLMLALTACDRDEASSDDLTEQTRQAASEDAETLAERAERHRARRVKRLCEALGCSDEQHTAIKALLAQVSLPKRPAKAERMAANQALAEAFAADGFSSVALADYRAAVDRDSNATMEHASAVLVGLHELLTAEQREQVAEMLRNRGIKGLIGRGGKGKHRHGAKGDDHSRSQHAGSARAERKATRLCQKVTCSDAQQTEIVAAMQAVSHDRTASKTANEALAQAFVGDGFGETAVGDYLSAVEAEHQAHLQAKDAMVVQIHGIFTTEQRATLADTIARHGPKALMGGKGRHGKRGRHGKHGKRHG